ncbi:Phytochrome sensor protein [uncultured Gammaproteobacteria bacterium]
MGLEPQLSQTGHYGGTGADEVMAYLSTHPDFLHRHPDAIDYLMPPRVDMGRDVADFQFFMVERLRSEHNQLQQRLREMVGTTRANQCTMSRVHAATLALLEARGLDALLQLIATNLPELLDLDLTVLVVENGDDVPRRLASGIRLVEPGAIDSRLRGADLLLASGGYGDTALFGSAAGSIRSQALLRLHLREGDPPSILALGSHDPEMFHPDQGTELVSFLAQVVERCLITWIEV